MLDDGPVVERAGRDLLREPAVVLRDGGALVGEQGELVELGPGQAQRCAISSAPTPWFGDSSP